MNYDPTGEPVPIIGGPQPATPSLARRIHDQLRRRIAEFLEFGEPVSLREAARALDLLPLSTDDGQYWYGLRADGDMLCFPVASPHEQQPVESQWRRTVELTNAATRYPELRGLIHPQPLSCRTCPRCGGQGKIRIVDEDARCICGGLGWLPAVEDPPVKRPAPSPTRG